LRQEELATRPRALSQVFFEKNFSPLLIGVARVKSLRQGAGCKKIFWQSQNRILILQRRKDKKNQALIHNK